MEFDTTKGAFLLVAIVIGTMMLTVVIIVSSCAYIGLIEAKTPVCTTAQEFVQEIIQMSFTAAIAFAGGRMSVPTVSLPKMPEKE